MAPTAVSAHVHYSGTAHRTRAYEMDTVVGMALASGRMGYPVGVI